MANNVFGSNSVDLYHLLGLNPAESNQPVIKKNFSDLIKVFHSDRGGDSRFHQQIVEAYRILSNPSRKFVYDNFGLLAVYTIKEDDEILKMYEDVVDSDLCTDNEKKIIKEYITKKILKKLNDKYTKGLGEGLFEASEITTNWSTGVLDYVYWTHFTDKADQVSLGRSINFNKISFDNHFAVYTSENNNKELSVSIAYIADQGNYNCEHTYSLDYHTKVFLPENLKLFEQNFFDLKMGAERIVGYNDEDKDIHLKSAVQLYNFLKFNALTFTISPSYSINNNQLNTLEVALQHSPSPSMFVQSKIDIMQKNCDFTFSYKKKKQKFITMLNFGNPFASGQFKRFSLGGFFFRNLSDKFSKSNSLFLRQNGVFLSNESIIHWKHLSVKFISNMQFSKAKKGFKFTSTLNLGIQIGNFKVQFPVAIANEYNFFSHGLILLSSILGNTFLKLRKRLSHGLGFGLPFISKHIAVMNKINKEKYTVFIENHSSSYEKKLQFERERNFALNGHSEGLTILAAYFGDYSKIVEIYKNLKIFGLTDSIQPYIIDDPLIFDAKIPLTLHIVHSKLIIPVQILEIDGIYIPDYQNKDNLALVCMYSYESNIYTTILRNNRTHGDVTIPSFI